MDFKKIMKNENFFAWMLLLPTSAVMIAIRLWPMIQGIGMSFTNRRLLNDRPLQFIGLDNYIRLFQDNAYWRVVSFTLIYTLGTVVISYLIGLIVALLMNMKIQYGRGIFRTILMIPWVLPWVVAAYIWRFSLNDQLGIINYLLQELSLTSSPVPFFSTPVMARISVIIVSSWKNFPFMALVLLAGLQNVSEEIKEAAKIDGASGWQTFIHVIFPQLKGVTSMCTTLMFIWTFNSFDAIFLLTSGGPSDATSVISLQAYQTAFARMSTGYATSMATLMLVFMLIIIMAYMRLLRGKEE